MNKIEKICDYIQDYAKVAKIYEIESITKDGSCKSFNTAYSLKTSSGNVQYRYEMSILNQREYIRKYTNTNDQGWVLEENAVGAIKGEVNIINILLLLSTCHHIPTIYSTDNHFNNDQFAHQDKLYVSIDAGVNHLDIETDKSNIVIKKTITFIDKEFVVVDVKKKDRENISERYIISKRDRMFIAYRYDDQMFADYGTCESIEYVFTDTNSPIDSIYLIPSESIPGEFLVKEINYRSSNIEDSCIMDIFNKSLTTYIDIELDEGIYLRSNVLYTGYDPLNNGVADFGSGYIEVFFNSSDLELENTMDNDFFKSIVFKVDESIDCNDLSNKIKNMLEKEKVNE